MSNSLAKIIIYGSNEDLAAYLKQEFPLNQIDEYGYTPLIQCAIVNSVSKGKMLIEAGADVNFSDLTGRTALHWAADNNNIEFVNVLLEQGANANAYTRAGQSVLVIPFLRNYNDIKQKLYQHNGDLNFAQDFINAKVLGHRYELEGRVDLVDNTGRFFEMEFEGFYVEFSLEIVANSLKELKHNFGGKHLRAYFDKLQKIIDCLQVALELIKYQHYLVDVKQYEKRILQLINPAFIIIPVCFSGHAITLIRYGNWLVRCDRGEYGRDNGTVIYYKLGKPQIMTKAFIKNLIYKRQDQRFINEELTHILDLKPMMSLPVSTQISGNCSWANVEATIPALLYLMLIDDAKGRGQINIKECEQQAFVVFQDWVNWDQQRALDFCLQGFYSANPARKASKAAILAAILFQRCSYEKEIQRQRSEKILKVLTTAEYRYILKAYLQIFAQEKKHPLYRNLLALLEDFGIDAQMFLDAD